MSATSTAEAIAGLELEHATAEDAGVTVDEQATEFKVYLTNYFSGFARPNSDSSCLKCGSSASFTWGLAHGAGHCFKCGWPARAYHFLKDGDGKEFRLVRILQYHPDFVTVRAPESYKP